MDGIGHEQIITTRLPPRGGGNGQCGEVKLMGALLTSVETGADIEHASRERQPNHCSKHVCCLRAQAVGIADCLSRNMLHPLPIMDQFYFEMVKIILQQNASLALPHG